MKAQVLTTSTSASSAHDVISIPRCKTLPSMISASTRFLAQPRLIMPTLGLRKRSVAFVVFTFSYHSKIHSAVVLSEALQRNAKHEARLSNISDYFRLTDHSKN